MRVCFAVIVAVIFAASLGFAAQQGTAAGIGASAAASSQAKKPAVYTGPPAVKSNNTIVGPSITTFSGNYDVGSAANGIGFSRHNLGRFGGVGQKENSFDICVYCHTPHNTSKKTLPPWASKGNSAKNYTAYGTNNPNVNTTTVGLGSPSFACLSCHDGLTTFDNLANSPVKMQVSPVLPLGVKNSIFPGSRGTSPVVSSRIRYALPLSRDHPINVPFRGGKFAALRKSDTIISQIDLSTGLSGWYGQKIPNLWSIKGYISDTATIADLLRDGRIECSSCHDPHFNNKSWIEAAKTFKGWDDMDGLFLRRVGGNFASSVCRTCHNK